MRSGLVVGRVGLLKEEVVGMKKVLTSYILSLFSLSVFVLKAPSDSAFVEYPDRQSFMTLVENNQVLLNQARFRVAVDRLTGSFFVSWEPLDVSGSSRVHMGNNAFLLQLCQGRDKSYGRGLCSSGPI